MDDVAPKLLEILQAAFHHKFDDSTVIAELARKLTSKTADYKDANAFAVEIGKILAGVYQENLSSDALPDGRMYYNIAKRVIEPTMKENYELVSVFSQDVQTALNHKAKIGIKGIKAPLKEDKIRGIVERLAEEEDFDAAKWLLDEPIVTFTQSVVNDTIEENTKFAYKAGLRPKIVRTEVGNCCEWCKEVAGTYEYPKVPKDVYRRHNRCRCTVEYFPGDGKKQDVYSKKWVDIEKDEKIKERIEKSKKVDYKPLNDGLIEKYQSKSDEVYASLSKSEREALSEYTQGGYLDINADLGSGVESYYTKSLNSSIDKFTIDSNIITYRGTNDKYYKGYNVGDTLDGKVFYSTSVNQDVAKAFADDITAYSDDGSKGVLLEIKVPKGSKALYIGENTDYKPDGYTVNENELLLSNKTKYKIEKIDPGKITMEVVL